MVKGVDSEKGENRMKSFLFANVPLSAVLSLFVFPFLRKLMK